MRHALLLAFLPLVACATPQETCIANATHDLRVVEGLIAVSQGNIRRGYAIETRDFIATEERACGVVKKKTVYCDVPVTETRKVPVAIDLAAERAKLQSLLEKRDQLVVRSEAAITQCRARYPEG